MCKINTDYAPGAPTWEDLWPGEEAKDRWVITLVTDFVPERSRVIGVDHTHGYNIR